MSWKVYAEPHDHVEGPYDEENSEPLPWSGCLGMICDVCKCDQELDGPEVIAHWQPDEKAMARTVAVDSEWYASVDIAYCPECRTTVAHECARDDRDDPCEICGDWLEEEE